MKRIISLVLASVLILTAVTACDTVKPTNSASEPTKVDLKVFMSMPQFKDQIDPYLAKFVTKEMTEKNIEVKINLDMPPNEKANEILRARLAAGNSPDVFTMNPTTDTPDYYKAGYLADLTDQPFVKTVLSSTLEVCKVYDKVYAVPLESSAWGLLYNKKIFTDVGITPARTLAEMTANIAKLKAANITPFMLAYQDGWVAQLLHALSAQGIVNTYKKTFVTDMNAGKGSYKDISDMFKIIDIVNQNGTAKASEVGYTTGATDFANGKAAMWIMGTWAADPILKANPNIQIGAAPLPVSDDTKAAIMMLSVSNGLGVASDSKNKPTALDLANYMLDSKDSSALFEALKWNHVTTFHTYTTNSWNDDAATYIGLGNGFSELKLPEAVSGNEAPKQMQAYAAGTATKDAVIAALDKAWADSLK